MNPELLEARILPVSKDILNEGDIDRLLVTSAIDERTLGPLLDELQSETCIHSWQGYLSRFTDEKGKDRVDALLRADQEARPTTTFVYFALSAQGAVIPVAAATVAERIHSSFPYEGFPVIARAYISRRFRGLGIYPFLVRHRIDYCVEEWGRRLRAVHLGSADPKVWKTVSRGPQFSVPFLYIGNESLKVGDTAHDVRDFLSLSEPYRRALLDAAERKMEKTPTGAPVHQLAEGVHKYVSRGHRFMPYGELAARREAAGVDGTNWVKRCQPVRELLAFCEAVPLKV